MSALRQSLDAKTDDDGVLGFANADEEEDDVDADDLDDASDEAAQEDAESDSDESGISSADSDDDISSGMEVDENVRRSVKAALGSAAVSSDAEVSLHSSQCSRDVLAPHVSCSRDMLAPHVSCSRRRASPT